MTLGDVLKYAYAERGISARIVEGDGAIAIVDGGYRLMLWSTSALAISVEGKISREAFYALGLVDEQTEGAVSTALDRAGHRNDAQQVRYSLDAIQAGRGPIYQSNEQR